MSNSTKVKFKKGSDLIELDLKPVISSNIQAYAFKEGYLYLTFKNGGPFIYQYDLTDRPELEQGFIQAESKGKFFYKHIKTLQTDKKLLL